MKKILVIGNSHVFALQGAKTADELFDFYHLNHIEISELSGINTDNYLSIILLVKGNYHHAFSIANYPESFDFYLPENPNLPINQNARILPVSLVYKILKRGMEEQFSITNQLLQIFNNSTFYQVCSPPPFSSNEFIKKNPGNFAYKISKLGVSPSAFRYKLWRLHTKIVRDNCEKLGITFIDVPEQSLDGAGFLAEKYIPKGSFCATHANTLYGDLVLNQIRALHKINI